MCLSMDEQGREVCLLDECQVTNREERTFGTLPAVLLKELSGHRTTAESTEALNFPSHHIHFPLTCLWDFLLLTADGRYFQRHVWRQCPLLNETETLPWHRLWRQRFPSHKMVLFVFKSCREQAILLLLVLIMQFKKNRLGLYRCRAVT